MSKEQWTWKQLERCKDLYGLAWVDDPPTLSQYSQDFGHLKQSQASAIFKPRTKTQLVNFIDFSHQQCLPITPRCFGLSQSGQSLSTEGSVILDMSQFDQLRSLDDGHTSIQVGCGAKWHTVIEASLRYGKLPPVIPYNLDLSIGGVLSAGGLGAASFTSGIAASYIDALEVHTASIGPVWCSRDQHADLFHATLAGLGQFGVISEAKLSLRDCGPQVKRYFLLYDDPNAWLSDQRKLKGRCDHLEAFTSPLVQGMHKKNNVSSPLISWFYCLQIAIEFDQEEPQLADIGVSLGHCKFVHQEVMNLLDYAYRHAHRFAAMKKNGQWEQLHPWYECFLPYEVLQAALAKILERVGMSFGGVYHIFPVNTQNVPRYFMLPKGDVFAFTMLCPGLSQEMRAESLDTIAALDAFLLPQGGKRYLSGCLGDKAIDWQEHYGDKINQRIAVKQRYDPRGIFCSQLIP